MISRRNFIAATVTTFAFSSISNVFGYKSRRLSVKDFGAIGDGLNDDAAAFARAFSSSYQILVPPGKYNIGDLMLDHGLDILNKGSVRGRLIFKNINFIGAGRFPVKTGDRNIELKDISSQLMAGDKIFVKVKGRGNPSYNQSGYEFAVIKSIDGSRIELEDPIRFSFDEFYVGKSEFSKSSEKYNRGYTELKVKDGSIFKSGDLIRIECIKGSDSVRMPGRRNYYYEISKIKQVSGDVLYLDYPLLYEYDESIVSIVPGVRGINISGGEIEAIQVEDGFGVSVKNIVTRNLILVRSVGFQFADILVKSNGPVGLGITSSRNGVIERVNACCANGGTDNGNIKIMSGADIIVRDIKSSNTNATSQGIYPLFVDYYFPPYASWSQNIIISGAELGAPHGGAQRSLWLVGGRDCKIASITAISSVLIDKSQGVELSKVISGAYFTTRDSSLVRAREVESQWLSVEGSNSIDYQEIKLKGGAEKKIISVKGSSGVKEFKDVSISDVQIIGRGAREPVYISAGQNIRVNNVMNEGVINNFRSKDR